MLAIAVVTLIATLLDLTLEAAVVHHGYRALTAKDFGGLRTLLRIAFAVDLGIGLAVGALILGLAGPLSDLLGSGEADASLVRVAVVIAFAQTVDGTTGAVLLLAGAANARLGGVRDQRPAPDRSALGGWRRRSAGGLSRLCGRCFRRGLDSGWPRLARRVEQVGPRGAARGRTRVAGKLRSFGIYSSVSSSVQGAQRSAVPVILGSLAGAQTVGIFSVALFPLTLASLATAPLRLLLFPEQADRRLKAMSTVFARPSGARRGSGWRSVCRQQLPDGSCCPSFCRLSTPVSSRTRSGPRASS